jgi:transcriptional regulator with XRE-family HTH domain/tetratricopeptide (TPR) repeat protein
MQPTDSTPDQPADQPIDVLIARARAAKGKSQHQLADLLRQASGNPGIDRGAVSRWEHGHRIPTPYWRRHLHTVLGIPPDALDRAAAVARARRAAASIPTRPASPVPIRGEILTPREIRFAPDPAPADGEPLEQLWEPARTVDDIDDFTLRDLALGRREVGILATVLVGAALTELLEGWLRHGAGILGPDRRGTLGQAELERIEFATQALRHWDDRFHLGIRRKAVVGQLNEVIALLKDGQPAGMARRLFAVAAELAKIAASMSYDAGLHPTAQRYYLFALRASHQAGDRLFGVGILANMARQLLDLGRQGDALELVRLALDGVHRHAPGRVQAMLRTREAWAYAGMGRVQAFHRAVGQARDSFAAAPVDQPHPHWVANFDEAELAGVIGARYRDLARHDPKQATRAVAYIQQAIDLRDPGKLRNRTFDTIGLGRAYLLLGEPEQACQLAEAALALAVRIGSGRVNRRLRDFSREADRYASSPVVADVRAKVEDHLRTTAS